MIKIYNEMCELALPSFALDNERVGGVKYRCGEGFARFRFCMERWERKMESALTAEERVPADMEAVMAFAAMWRKR